MNSYDISSSKEFTISRTEFESDSSLKQSMIKFSTVQCWLNLPKAIVMQSTLDESRQSKVHGLMYAKLNAKKEWSKLIGLVIKWWKYFKQNFLWMKLNFQFKKKRSKNRLIKCWWSQQWLESKQELLSSSNWKLKSTSKKNSNKSTRKIFCLRRRKFKITLICTSNKESEIVYDRTWFKHLINLIKKLRYFETNSNRNFEEEALSKFCKFSSFYWITFLLCIKILQW